jgi:homoserine kinase
MSGAGDEVTVRRQPGRGLVHIEALTGLPLRLPDDPHCNTATAGLVRLLRDTRADFDLYVSIKKGIAIGSGMGGSAASAVAAVVAASRVLPRPLKAEQLFHYALLGEKEASGSIHGDNVAPCLLGGLCLVRSAVPADIVSLPVPRGLFGVLVHPHLEISTRAARKILKREVSLDAHVQQTANLAGFIAACYSGDLGLIRRSLEDVVIEPQRKKLIPGFDRAKTAALAAGALGVSISGSGPSVFAFADSRMRAAAVRAALVGAFSRLGSDSWLGPVGAPGARVIA